MEDSYVKAKSAARTQMMIQAQSDKDAFVRKMKNGFGDVLVKELEMNKRPTWFKRFWRRLIKVLGG
jgi:hypothetical protein